MTSGAAPAPVLAIATCDTKAEELAYVAGLIRARGLPVVSVDVGTSGAPSPAGVSAAQVAAHHPDGPDAVFAAGDRGRAVIAMSQALVRFITTRPLAGAIGLGGSGGTSLIAPALRALPLGMPKLMVSTVASGDVSGYVGVSDLMMLYPVTDIAGLNSVSRAILANAAHAMAGMAQSPPPRAADSRPALAFSMFGVTTPAVQELQARLAGDYDCLVFHANGPGGRALEATALGGMVRAVIDLTTTEAADHLMGGICSAGPERFDMAARTGLPWVVSCGALDMVNFGPRASLPARYEGRLFHVHNAQVTLMRTTPEENARMGAYLAAKLNAAAGPVDLLLPLGGVSALDAPGQAFHDPAADAALFGALESGFRPSASRRLHRVDAHINDDAFAAAAETAIRAALGP